MSLMYSTQNSMLSGLLQAANEAGNAIMRIYQGGNLGTTLKADRSPLTLADTASHEILVNALRRLTPQIPALSEESQSVSYDTRKSWKEFWLVDPLDGTKEFIKRNGEFTVNIALIREQRPVLGIVFAPAKDLMYFAEQGKGAYKTDPTGKAVPIQVTRDIAEGLKIVASRSHASPEMQEILDRLGPRECVSMGSSLKFCLVAEGQAHLYPRLLPTMEWDTAAAQCIAKEAGAEVTDLAGKELIYNKENFLNPYFMVSALPQDFWKKYFSKQPKESGKK